MFDLLSNLVPIFCIIFAGAAVQRLRVLNDAAATSLNQFVYWISLPSLLFTQLAKVDTGSASAELLTGIFAALIVSFAVAFCVARVCMRCDNRESVMHGLHGSFPNYVFIGLPAIALLFPGNEFALTIATILTVLGNATLLFVDAVLGLLCRKGDGQARTMTAALLAFVKNPVLMSTFFGVLFNVGGVLPPPSLMTVFSMLAVTSAPCALFSVGMLLSIQIEMTQGISVPMLVRHLPVHLTKLVAQPALTYACLCAAGVSGVALNVVTVVSAMPTAVSSIVIAEKYGVAIQDAPIIILVSTVFSMLTIALTVIVLYTTSGLGGG